MAYKIDAFVALTGGGTGALDKISVADRQTNDMAQGVVNGVFYVYRYNSASSAAEDPPDIIAPDVGSGRWELVAIAATELVLPPKASSGSTADGTIFYCSEDKKVYVGVDE